MSELWLDYLPSSFLLGSFQLFDASDVSWQMSACPAELFCAVLCRFQISTSHIRVTRLTMLS
jgi:hypothetical protein